MTAIGRTASLDAWWFFQLCVGVLLELARCCVAHNALNGGVIRIVRVCVVFLPVGSSTIFNE